MLYDAVIIGAGLNGMLVYNAFKNIGLNVCIVEKNDILNNKFDDNRTIAISQSTKTFLESLGLWKSLDENFGIINYIYTFEKTTKPILEFAGNEFLGGELGYIVLATNLLNVMFNNICKADIISQDEILEINQDNSICKLKTKNNLTIQSKMVIACNGKNSDFAKKFNIKSFKSSYNQKAITFIANHTNNHNNIAVEQFSSVGPLATLPMKQRNQSGFVWSLRSDLADYIFNTNEEDFLNLLNNELQRVGCIGKILSTNDIISKPRIYPLNIEFLLKKNYGRVIFIGDVLNAIHPVAGQAFNMSVNDIIAICKSIKENIDIGLDFSLPVYLKETSFGIIKNHISLNLSTDLLVRGYSNNNNVAKIFRTISLEIFSSSKHLKSFAVKLATFGV